LSLPAPQRTITTQRNTLIYGTFLSPGGTYIQDGEAIHWQIPAIPPQTSTTITLAVTAPATAADFLPWDTGAEVSAMQWCEDVAAAARPISLAPRNMAASLLQSTMDANRHDTDMLWWTARMIRTLKRSSPR
jgi:hypothetical protein